MKLYILLAFFLLGSLTYEVRCQSGSGLGDVEGDDEDILIEHNENDKEASENDEEEETPEYVIDCDYFNLELCLHDYDKYDYFFSDFTRNDPVCWESYAATECMHSYVKACFPVNEATENFLCKLSGFKDKLMVLCLNDTEVKFTETEATDEEILECLEGAQTDAEECVEEIIPQVAEFAKEIRGHIDQSNPEAFQGALKCLLMSKMLECVVNRLEHKCPEEVVEGFLAGAEEELADLMGDKCTITLSKVVNIK